MNIFLDSNERNTNVFESLHGKRGKGLISGNVKYKTGAE